MGASITIVEGDITRLNVDAIVNAAIHRSGGLELLAACRSLGGCPTGEAKTTKDYRLPACHVIHTVRPVWQGGGAGEAALLASCNRRCLEIAAAAELNPVAFPLISTGI